MTSKFVEIVPLSHRQGNGIPSAAIRWPDFGDRPSFGRPFAQIFRHSDTPLLSFSPGPSISPTYAGAGLRRNSSIRRRISRNRFLGTATSANCKVTLRPCGRRLFPPASRTSGYGLGAVVSDVTVQRPLRARKQTLRCLLSTLVSRYTQNPGFRYRRSSASLTSPSSHGGIKDLLTTQAHKSLCTEAPLSQAGRDPTGSLSTRLIGT